MKALRFLDRRAGYSLASIGLLLGMVVPAVLPAFASASIVTSRSVELSSSAAAQANVNYKVTFTPATTEATGYVVIFFCNDSPIPGQTCTAPTGLSASSATLGAASDASSAITQKAAAKVEIDDSTTHLTSGTPAVFELQAIHNPTNPTDGSGSNGLYARIQTYANSTDADAAYAAGAASTTGIVDEGGVAMSITSSIGVTATVRETMTFCVAGNVGMNAAGPSGNCGVDASGGSATGLDTSDVGLTLGHGTPAALDSSALDTASDWAQISTNAASGAVVRMTNTNGGNCSGLFRTSASGCDIAGAGTSAATIAPGNALFGMRLGTVGSAPFSVATPTGTLTPLAPYDGGSGTQYGMGTNVTSTYGDPIFNTAAAPIANKNVKLTFAASAAPTTPAGIYQATMNLIATGTF